MSRPEVLVLASGRIIDPRTTHDNIAHDGEADVVIERGTITRIGRNATAGIEAARENSVQRINYQKH